MVVKLKPKGEISQLHSGGFLSEENFQLYQETCKQNETKRIEILKVNRENECKNCRIVYKVQFNNEPGCSFNDKTHEPLYQIEY